jgi:eukaryotic-like serine/threonine-protein kinase
LLAAGLFVLMRGPGGPPGKTTTVFADDFHDGDSGWSGSTWTSGSGYYAGGYRIDAGDYAAARWEGAPFKGTLPDRLLLSVDATAKAGPPYGQLAVYCRASGSSTDLSSYDFLVRADGQGVLIRKEAGARGAKELARKSSAAGFKKGAKNRLQAACEQDGKAVWLRLWINGTFAAEAVDRDGPLPAGAAGLVARLDNSGSGGTLQALFDNLDLSSIG